MSSATYFTENTLLFFVYSGPPYAKKKSDFFAGLCKKVHPMQEKVGLFAQKSDFSVPKVDHLTKSECQVPDFWRTKSRTFIIDFIWGLCVAGPLPRDAHNQPPCESRHEVWVIASGVATAIATPERRDVEKAESFHASSKHSGQGEDLCRRLQICIEIAAAS